MVTVIVAAIFLIRTTVAGHVNATYQGAAGHMQNAVTELQSNANPE